MEWLFEWFDKLAHGFVIQVIMDHSSWVDWFALLFIVIGIVYGIQNGLLSELAEILQIIVVIFLTFFLYHATLTFLLKNKRYLPIPTDLIEATAFITIGISVWAILGFLYKFLAKFFHIVVSRELRVIGGAILGGFHLFIIFSFVCQSLLLMPYHSVKKPFEKGHSFTGVYLKDLAPKIYESISDPKQLIYSELD